MKMVFNNSQALLLLLLLFVANGSAQLKFINTGNVIKTVCNNSALLPCFVKNLKEHKEAAMFVEWKFNDQAFFSFDGSTHTTKISPNFSSAELHMQDLTKGDISLTIVEVSQAVDGKYTCDVTEVSRTGFITFSLRSSEIQLLELQKSVPVTVLLCVAVVAFWIHFGITFAPFYKYKPSEKAVKVIAVAGEILTIVLIIGVSLLFALDYSPGAIAGLGLAVIPTMILILVLQHFLHPTTVALLVLFALKTLGFLLAIVGCCFCLSTCPPTMSGLLLSGNVIFTTLVLVDLVYSSLQEYYRTSDTY